MLVPISIFLLIGQGFGETNTRFTNVECEVMDPSFAKFLKCDLKIIGRGIVGLNIQLRYFKLHRKILVRKELHNIIIYIVNTIVSSGKFKPLEKIQWVSPIYVQHDIRLLYHDEESQFDIV